MSLQAIVGAIETAAPTTSAKLLMIILANYADAQGRCYPGQNTLCGDTGLSVRAVRDNLNALEAAGLIERHQRRRPDGSKTSDLFILLFTQAAKSAASQQPAEKEGGHRQMAPSSPAASAGHEPKGERSEEPTLRSPPALDLEGGPDMSPARMALDLYNQVAERVGGFKAEMTDARRKALNARMNGRGFPLWQQAMEMVERSQFLCGEVSPSRGRSAPFKLSLKMLLVPENFQNLLEGFYGNDRDPGDRQDLGGARPAEWSAVRWGRVMEIYRTSGAWPDDAGPEPGQPGCLAPQNGDDYVYQ